MKYFKKGSIKKKRQIITFTIPFEKYNSSIDYEKSINYLNKYKFNVETFITEDNTNTLSNITINEALIKGSLYEKRGEIENALNIYKNDALIAQAKKNIKNNPIKYLRNISSNISRMFFNIPNSYFYQRDITTTFRLFPNSILFTLILFSSLITVFNLKKIPQALRHFIGITFIYLFLSSLLSAFPRMLNISIPLILIWISYTLKYWKESA